MLWIFSEKGNVEPVQRGQICKKMLQCNVRCLLAHLGSQGERLAKPDFGFVCTYAKLVQNIFEKCCHFATR